MIFKPSTLQLLRFPFSFFLMPVYWFALSSINDFTFYQAVLIFFIVHLLLYPSSNGYNSYMDKDTDSIGGVKYPMAPEKELFYATLIMDILAIGLSFFVSILFTCLIGCYILFSRLYSYRGVRLKKYPIIGYLTVVLNQGGLMFLMVYQGANAIQNTPLPWLGMASACFLIGGFYPITQIYQHEPDARDGVQTISIVLGKKGTFLFCVGMYVIAFILLFLYYQQKNKLVSFGVLQIFFMPVLVYFSWWLSKVWKDESFANFTYTMRMNWLASSCMNLGFFTLFIIHNFG